MFRNPNGDLAQNLVGHLAFQLPGWHWPILQAPSLAWPSGESVAMTDSNPALSIIAKLVAISLGHIVNLFGLWVVLCLMGQPVAAVYAIRGLRWRARQDDAAAWIAAGTASLVALLLPAFLFRINAINLFGQFLLLLALGYAARCCAARRMPPLGGLAGFLTLVVFVHPYLFMFDAVILSAPALQMVVQRQPGAREAMRRWGLAALLPIFAFMTCSMTLGGGGPGFGLYSTNLLAPVWPQMSGLFGADLPVLNATGFQYEGFNYLGAGNVLLLGIAAILLLRGGAAARREIWRDYAGLWIAVACLAALAVTPHVTAGPISITTLDIPLLDKLFAAMRSSGRAIWVADYALLMGAVGVLASRLRVGALLPLLATVLILQWVDTAPLRHKLSAYVAGSDRPGAPPLLPTGTLLFRAVPLCADNAIAADEYRLAAFRAGAHLAEIRLAHPPLPAACAAAASAGLNDPMAPGETRLFQTQILGDVQQDRLGAHVACTPVSAGLLCHRNPES